MTITTVSVIFLLIKTIHISNINALVYIPSIVSINNGDDRNTLLNSKLFSNDATYLNLR